MSHLIDTDILSYYFKANPIVVKNFTNYFATNRKLPYISVITHYEIISGLQAINAKKQMTLFSKMFSPKNILLITPETSIIAANIFSKTRNKGIVVDDIDILIAACAVQKKLTVVTNNEKHFGKIPGIKIENWAKKEFNR
jgi:tRNA(fMet)-specific endonuclease VapC